MKKPDKIEQIAIDDLLPYAKNSRTHSPEQVAQIAASMVEFGWTNPVLIDANGMIVAGHGRVLAARKLKMDSVPCIRLGHLTPTQARAYVIADNQLALNAGWDDAMLKAELDVLKEEGFEMGLLGFSDAEINEIIEEAESDYTAKIQTPIYTPKGEKPKITDLVDSSKFTTLCDEIKNSKVPEDVKQFLIKAANRHLVFDYHLIAEYYSHAPKEIQELMERSGLVIIDFNKAVEAGFVELSKKLSEIYNVTEEMDEMQKI